MAMMRRITEINGEIIVVETMIIVGEIVLIYSTNKWRTSSL